MRLLNVGGVIATVLAPADRDGGVQVQAGPMKMTVKENELRLVEEKKNTPKPKPQPRRDAPRRELNIRSAESEVDVRGMSAEEALFEVDNFCRAIMAGPSVTVIHGKEPACSARPCSICEKQASRASAAVFTAGEQGEQSSNCVEEIPHSLRIDFF
ncbi:MAG: MutS2/Smr-associated SH3 domain-containing protein [Butyricicoccus sp.]